MPAFKPGEKVMIPGTQLKADAWHRDLVLQTAPTSKALKKAQMNSIFLILSKYGPQCWMISMNSFIALLCPIWNLFQAGKSNSDHNKVYFEHLEDVREEFCLVNIKLEWVLRLAGRNRKFLKCFDVIHYVWLVDLIWNLE